MRRAIKWAAVGLALLPATAGADTIRVQSTTDTVDAGLVGTESQATFGLLQAYKQAQPGDTVQYTAVGTGAALTNARNGQADVVITHAPTLEKQFVDDGYSVGLGRQIFYSDYVIVGPKSDPAGVLGKHPDDAIGAFEDIAANSTFVSRGDNSGTNVQEQIMWALTSGVALQQPANAGSATNRKEPSDTSWYKKTNKGQAANLQEADVCGPASYPKGNCYTMVDRGTFNRLVNSGTVTNLKIVSQKNKPAARGGENLLVNPFSIYIVNPAKFSSGTIPNETAARRFVSFIVSKPFQDALESFPSAVDPAFRPDAFAEVKLTSQTPPAVLAGEAVTFAGTVGNRLPGGGFVPGQSVQLQGRTDEAAAFADIGAPVTTDAEGRFSVSATPEERTHYKLELGDQPASTYNQFTASETDLGIVGVATKAPPVATVPPGEDAPSFITDNGKSPKVSSLRLTRKSLTLKVSEAATVTVTISRKGKKVQTIKGESGGAETLSIRHKVLKRGRYKLRIVAVDSTGSKRTTQASVRRR